MHDLSFRSIHGSAMMYVTAFSCAPGKPEVYRDYPPIPATQAFTT